MPCSLSAGYAIDCREAVGGVEVVYVIENSALYDASGNTRVVQTSGTVTALTKNTGKRFYKIEVPRQTAVASTNLTGSQENGTIFYTHQVMFPINSRTATVRNLISTLAQARLTVVTKEMDGTFRMYGASFGLFLDTNEGGSGTAAGDRNGNMLTLTSVERDDFLVVPANIAATLETAG